MIFKGLVILLKSSFGDCLHEGSLLTFFEDSSRSCTLSLVSVAEHRFVSLPAFTFSQGCLGTVFPRASLMLTVSPSLSARPRLSPKVSPIHALRKLQIFYTFPPINNQKWYNVIVNHTRTELLKAPFYNSQVGGFFKYKAVLF